jgi:cytochrome c-type biogenesis protein CcmH
MGAFAIACLVFAAGCFAALALRLSGIVRRESLAAVLLPLFVAALAGGGYAWFTASRAAGTGGMQLDAIAPAAGDMQDLSRQIRGKLGPDASPPAQQAGDLHALSAKLAEKLARDPKNAQGWALLARSYANIQQFSDAAGAFEKAAKLLPRDASLLADWADARVMAQGRKWDKQALQIVEQALAADPRNLKALALAGTEATERGDYRKAATYWSRMKAAAPAGSPELEQAEANLAEAQSMTGGKGAAPANPPPAAAAAIAPSLSGRISLDPAFKDIPAQAVIFVIAKDPKGAGPPIAAKRFSALELPLAFQLGEADAMVPGRGLSEFAEVLVSARLSKSGDALPKAGDIESKVVLVRVGSSDIMLRLGTARAN